MEKLWAAGKAICRGTRRHRQQLEAWVAAEKKKLRQGHVDEVIAEIDQALASTAVTGPGNKFRREVISTVRDRFLKNVERMRYAKLRRADLEIGSGVIEGAVRHLVGIRLDGPGMRWGRDRAGGGGVRTAVQPVLRARGLPETSDPPSLRFLSRRVANK